MHQFIENKFSSIIDQLKAGKRPYFKLDSENITTLRREWANSLTSYDGKSLNAIFCILEHTTTMSDEFDQLSLDSIDQLKDEQFIFLLGVIRHQIIERCQIKGDRLDQNIIARLADVAQQKKPEVKEWILRTLEVMGNQAITVRKKINQLRPNGIVLNRHKLACRQLVDLMESRWATIK